ncbi:MAG: hypothetical protein GVY13_09245 [Alphaproteobacteria bacterium]|nr:hypothetical protein [Alphaproteobacteria bacterium]
MLAQPATYTAAGGGDTSCQAMPMGGGEAFAIGRVRLTAERETFHLRRAVVGTPTEGTITVDGVEHTITAGEPVEGDSRGLFWAVHAAWGLELQWTTPGAGGASQYDAPPPELTYTAAAASAGATTLTVNSSGFTTGYARDGDTLTVDGSDYTITADVPLSYSGGYRFADVPITPSLASTLSGGETVTFTPAGASNTRAVRAALADYEAAEIMGGIQAGDRRVVVRAGDIDPAPTTADTVEIDGTSWSVVKVERVHIGDAVVAYAVQLRI